MTGSITELSYQFDCHAVPTDLFFTSSSTSFIIFVFTMDIHHYYLFLLPHLHQLINIVGIIIIINTFIISLSSSSFFFLFFERVVNLIAYHVHSEGVYVTNTHISDSLDSAQQHAISEILMKQLDTAHDAPVHR